MSSFAIRKVIGRDGEKYKKNLRNEKQKKKFMGRGKQTSHPYDFMRD
jgi:hypothetical protein